MLMTDTYAPSPHEAVCPHCAHAVTATLDSHARRWAGLRFRCSQCAGEWHEIRDATTTERYWTPATVEPPA
jgi:formate dehydrogenase maturation protein FdhE